MYTTTILLVKDDVDQNAIGCPAHQSSFPDRVILKLCQEHPDQLASTPATPPCRHDLPRVFPTVIFADHTVATEFTQLHVVRLISTVRSPWSATMTAVITISSSPERIAPHTPTPPTDDSRALRRTSVPDSSPDSVISPSELCRLPMRSKYFGKKGLAEEPPTQALDATAEKTTSNRPGRKKKPAGEKQQAKGQKPIAKATAAAPGESSLERTTNAPKKTTETKKKRAGKGDKLANKVLTGRVAKAGSGQPQEPMKQSKASATPERSSRQKSIRDSVDDEEDLQLEAAMKRRMDWTPTQDTPKETEEMIGNDREVDEEGKLLGFGNLMAGYNFSGDVPAPHNNTESFSDGGPTKRRRIDVSSNVYLAMFIGGS